MSLCNIMLRFYYLLSIFISIPFFSVGYILTWSMKHLVTCIMSLIRESLKSPSSCMDSWCKMSWKFQYEIKIPTWSKRSLSHIVRWVLWISIYLCYLLWRNSGCGKINNSTKCKEKFVTGKHNTKQTDKCKTSQLVDSQWSPIYRYQTRVAP